jgi:protocatechuate 3,4-dioxygenase beta subunit
MLAHFGRRLLGNSPELESPIGAYRICRVESLESRKMMATDLQMGAVYYDPHAGDGLQPQLFYINFQGGADGTQLTHLTINLNKNGTATVVDPGPTSNDDFFHTASSTYMPSQGFPLSVVSADGVTVTNATVQNDSTELDLDFSGFTAGKTLVFSIKVDEAQDPNNVVVEGAEFQGAQLTATFSNPNYYTANGSATFFDAYNFGSTGLTLPPDSYDPPSPADAHIYTAGAQTPLTQTPLPSSLAGIVYLDNTGQGTYQPGDTLLSGVTVNLLDQDGNIVGTQTTNASGAYKFTGLLPGTYSVHEVQPNGYFEGSDFVGSLNGTSTGPDDLTSIVVGPNQNGINYNFYEIPPNSISGQVKLETYGDCETHPEDPPLAGVTIQLLNGEGTVIGSTVTDSNGDYTFANLHPGTYSVRDVVPTGDLPGDSHVGSEGGTTNGPTEVDGAVLVGGVDGLHYDFCIIPPNSISGVVMVEPQLGSTNNPNNTPLAGVTVQLINGQGIVAATTTTNSQGQYSFNMLMPDTYSVREIEPNGYIQAEDKIGSAGGNPNGSTELDSISLLGGINATNYNFYLVPPTSISGQMKLETFGDCETHPEDPPLAGVTIQLLNAQGSVISTTTTDSNGDYTFSHLLPGTYSVRDVIPAGDLPGDSHVGTQGGNENGPTEVDGAVLPGGVNATGYDFCVIPPNTISGVVLVEPQLGQTSNPQNTPLAGVTLQLLDNQGNVLASTSSNSAGQYSFTMLMPGTYSVRELEPSGYIQAEDKVGSQGGTSGGATELDDIALLGGVNASNYNFYLVPPTSISGQVKLELYGDCLTTPSDPPAPNVTIQLLNQQGTVIASTTTDSNGEYAFNNLPPGNYSVREIVPAGEMASDDHVGSLGGTLNGPTEIDGVLLTGGASGLHYDFCLVPPGSITGIVTDDIDGLCDESPTDPHLSGVTINLLDAQDNIIATTVTDANGRYTFNNLFPGTYGVSDEAAPGFILEDADVGSLGGVSESASLVDQIMLTAGAQGNSYDFCQVPPGSLSGFVFQDGPAILLTSPNEVVTPQSAGRDGIYQPGDPPIAGVTMVLGDANGIIMFDSNGHPIETTTDANGFYQFNNLVPNQSYTVIEIEPNGYIKGLDTAGSAGGLALNAGVVVPFGIVTQVSPFAIVSIPIAPVQSAVENNFSELVTTFPPIFLPDTSPPPQPPLAMAPLPAQTPVPQPPPYVLAQPNAQFGGSGGDGFTWHLSVIDAGQPRGDATDGSVVMLTAQTKDKDGWINSALQVSPWTLITPEGDLGQEDMELSRKLQFGMHGGVPVTGDFNGDGVTDVGVFYRGQWFIDLNGNGVWDKDDLWAKLGYQDDQPVVGDWDGDGKADIGIFGLAWPGDPRAIAEEPGLPDPDNTNAGVRKNAPPRTDVAPHGWRSMQRTSQGKVRADLIDHVFNYGAPGDRAFAGDWNGAGVDTIGVFHDGLWALDVDGNGKRSDGDHIFRMGRKGDQPVIGDFNGDGTDEIGVYRNGTWYIDINRDHVIDDKDLILQLGSTDDTPVVGDWNGDGSDEIGVYHQGKLEHPVTQK